MYVALNEAEKKKINKKNKKERNYEFYTKNFLKSLVNDNKTLSNLLSMSHTRIPIFVFNPTS